MSNYAIDLVKEIYLELDLHIQSRRNQIDLLIICQIFFTHV